MIVTGRRGFTLKEWGVAYCNFITNQRQWTTTAMRLYKEPWTWALAATNSSECQRMRRTPDGAMTKPTQRIPRLRLLLRVMLRFVERYSRPRLFRAANWQFAKLRMNTARRKRGNKQPRSTTKPRPKTRKH